MGFKLPKIKAPKIKIDNKSLKNFGKNLTGYVSPLYAASQKKAPPPPNPGDSPELIALRERMYGEANDFRSNLEGMKGDARQGLQRSANTAVDQGTENVRTSMNQRGMLYSGMREAGEQGVRASAASNLARSSAQSNKELEDMANRKDDVAANVGLAGYRDAVAREEAMVNQNMANQVARAQAMQQIGQGAGRVVGAYAGGTRTPAPEIEQNEMYSTANTNTGGAYISPNIAGKAGAAIASGDSLGDKHAPGAARTYAAPEPTKGAAPMPHPILASAGAQPATQVSGLGGAMSAMPKNMLPSPLLGALRKRMGAA